MARKHRNWIPGATYHITARGNRKDTLFYENKDYETYLELLTDIKEREQFHLHAYCLMPNHIHLLLEPIKTTPTKIIKFIHTNYAITFNRKYDLSGHVFQGRFHAKHVLDDEYFLKASQYIHLNPLEANIVKSPEAYKWSSYPAYLGQTQIPFLTVEKTLSYFKDQAELIKYTVEKQDPKKVLSKRGTVPTLTL
ncbi:REP-associated tyrosine transposase [Ornithinibacillus halotolerans]|uniref:Transposase IS200-like domain-containing protein n=1 Tax=Ornithinibacillus halotolerans TaxID=1274357 RepID=A0A916RQ82_9BACI|nr:transposase [Ornithinibacillus halotolerans]GGA65042.1 hypothetical protein GCM10008025_06050 [Ornithinibacillus halotolerans]